MTKETWKRYWTLARTNSNNMTAEQVSMVMDADATVARAAYLARKATDPLTEKSNMRAMMRFWSAAA